MSFPDSEVERSGHGVDANRSFGASNAALDELTKRLRSSAGSAAPVAASERPPASGGRRYAIAALVTIGILSAAIVFGARMWPTATEATRTLASRVASTVPMLRNMILEPNPAPANEPPLKAPTRAASRRALRMVRPQPPVASGQPVAAAFDAPTPLIERAPMIPPGASVEESNDVIYSSADPEVTPPKVRSADMPGRALGSRRPPEDTLEVLVSEEGIVEQAKLHTREPHMLDPMFLSLVKMWRFDPARREGHPVAYRLMLAWQDLQVERSGAREIDHIERPDPD